MTALGEAVISGSAFGGRPTTPASPRSTPEKGFGFVSGMNNTESRVIEYLKLLGGLVLGIGTIVTVFIGIREYAGRNERDKITDIFNSIQLVEQGKQTVSFRTDLRSLISQFYDHDVYPGDIDADLKKDAMSNKVNDITTNIIFKKYLLNFKIDILGFLDRMHYYGETGPCQWLVISKAFSADENFSNGVLTDKNRDPIPFKASCNS
jgi:hypothetical protein